MRRASLLGTVRLGINSLMLHKLRSILTTLGVLFGVSSVIAMLAIGEGASEEAQEQIRKLGSRNVILRSVKPTEDVVSGGEATRVSSYGLTDFDFQRVDQTFPGVLRAVPVRQLQQEVRLNDRALNPRVLATIPEYVSVTGRPTSEGRFLSPEDQLRFANVCVLGYEVARYLSPFETPIGKRIKIGADYFTCVGVLLPRVPLGSDQPTPGADVTGEVFLPMETARRWFGDIQVKIRSGSRDMEEVQLHEIIAEAESDEAVPSIAAAAREMLARQHKQRDYEVVVPLEQLLRAQETKRIFTIVLSSIAAISLLVGGIGIMNVMLATVTERTREIGIRRALGAKKRHIVTQFLVETVVLSIGGGLLGIALGLLIPVLVEKFADMRTIVTPAAPLLAFVISAVIGIVFGLYPAWRAANMDPVEALRHE
ncbi:MAG: ABC transporter permease [Planctomycetota bacterium]|nr:ABC transporter permease [Planctomycetota bacterium]